jgi:hypothetical protein
MISHETEEYDSKKRQLQQLNIRLEQHARPALVAF